MEKVLSSKTCLMPSENIMGLFISLLRRKLRRVLKVRVAMNLVREVLVLDDFARSIYPTFIRKIVLNDFILKALIPILNVNG
jgi:hypothetical protein